MSATFLLWVALGTLCFVGAVLAMQEASPVKMLVFAGYGLLFGMLARRERR